ncbi:RHS repeat domain-containing protein [Chitinophaga flava]|uniref:RHS repeat-associated core domain-containing protein n=1 Tax=Chitinophaga flava TaxID=2259036 RepID=A0A365Y2D0_9BACT|nr:RHS repeat-associated core domain-containing protein [Chitinophaga flava]RBL92759.1 hypothetical protein DF182_09330 [Chitinophaga flava]
MSNQIIRNINSRLLPLVTMVVMLLSANTHVSGQLIKSAEKITIPEAGSDKVITAGQQITYISAKEIEILPNTTIELGAEVTFSIGDIVTNSNMNWRLSRTFGATGELGSEVITFYNEKGSEMQTQRKNLTSGMVLASQYIYDYFDRPTIKTLLAPTMTTKLDYKSDFVTNTAGGVYNAANFDEAKQLNPDAVGNNVAGTLGWYYSNNNTLEPYVGATGYPYSNTSYFKDGSGAAKFISAPGEALKMGGGHELQKISLGIAGELANYISLRNKFFTTAELGALPADLNKAATKVIEHDQNGQENISILDQNGKTLMTGLPGADLQVDNSHLINPATHIVEVGGGRDYLYNWDGSYANVRVYNNTNNTPVLIYQGPSSGAPSGNITFPVRIESDQPFSLAVGQRGPFGIKTVYRPSYKYIDPVSRKYCYFYLNKSTAVNISGSGWTLLNMNNNEQPVAFTSGASLPAGYYKVITNSIDNAVTVTYQSGFSDLSYKFYNQLGQLVAIVPPEGVKKLLGTGLNNYTNRADIPFITQQEYNLKGQLTAVTNKEAGRTEFVYTTDGKARFSQNAVQRPTGRYAYTNFDKLGRNTESGEFTPGSGGISFSTAGMSNIDVVTNDGGLGVGVKSDWVKTVYDIPVAGTVSGYVQDEIYLGGNVSYTENAAGVKTWYNYDEQGKVIWRIMNIPGLGSKTIDYTYNALGKIVKKIYQKTSSAETFVHYYEYDQDQDLKAVYTNTTDDNASKKLQAKYTYYLHGPLKRIELGGNVQGLDYTYTVKGDLKAINNSNRDMDPGMDGISGVNAGFAKDVFGMNLEYYDQDYQRNNTNINSIQIPGTYATDLFNGTKKGLSWHSRKPASVLAVSGSLIENPAMYALTYDNKSQMKTATWGTPSYAGIPAFSASSAFNEKVLNYDSHGNIINLQRTDATGAITDNFTYNYANNGNQLLDIKNGTSLFDTYAYDALGRVIQETLTGAAARYLKYDFTNKVAGLYTDAALTQGKVTYLYNEAGIRVVKKDWVNNTTTYYVPDVNGNILATYNQVGTATPVQAEVALYGGDGRIGLFRRAAGTYEYELSDHLGNVRAVIDGSRNIKQYTDYYPFGSVARTGGSQDYRYGYQGQYSEQDPETGWNAFELRMYDSRIGRWLSIDPEFQYASPYLSMGNDPFNRTDPNGGLDGDPPGTAGPVKPWLGYWAQPVEVTAERLYRGFPWKYHTNALKNYRGNDTWWGFLDAIKGYDKQFIFVTDYFAPVVEGFALGGLESIGLSGYQITFRVALKTPGTSAFFGEMIGWGESQAPKAAKITIRLTKKLTKAVVEELKELGLPKEWVEKQLESYGKALADPRKAGSNINLLPRKALMEKILSLW